MATIPPGTEVTLRAGESAKLRFPPPESVRLYVAVHEGALKIGEGNRLTQVVGCVEDELHWVGALDERMLDLGPGSSFPWARSLITDGLFGEDDPWDIVWPGLLTTGGVRRPYYTIYDGDRPWVTLGRCPEGLLAAPLNDARGNPKWWTPRIDAADLEFVEGKAAQVELAHLWTIGEMHMRTGRVADRARAEVEARLRAYLS